MFFIQARGRRPRVHRVPLTLRSTGISEGHASRRSRSSIISLQLQLELNGAQQLGGGQV